MGKMRLHLRVLDVCCSICLCTWLYEAHRREPEYIKSFTVTLTLIWREMQANHHI